MSGVTTTLKGTAFAERLAAACKGDCSPAPLPDLRYRRILMPGLVGGELHYAMLGLLAHALRLRGAETTLLACDAILPACTSRRAEHRELACTRWCHANHAPFSAALNHPLRWYGEFAAPSEREQCDARAASLAPADLARLEYRDIALGPLIDHSLRAYFKVGAYDPAEPRFFEQGRRFAAAGMLLVHIGERAIEQLRPDKLVFEDGKKIDWGVLRAVALRRDIGVDVLFAAPRSGCFCVEHDDGRPNRDAMPRWSTWRDLPLTDAQNALLDEYFAQRATRPYGPQPWTDLTPRETLSEIRRGLALPADADGLTFAMFPNLGYDAGVTSSAPIYPTCTEWVAETIRFFADQPRHHLLIKVHPSEKLRAAQDQMTDFVAQTFPQLPPNVRVIPPDTTLTAHDVLRATDVALVYSSTIGLEAAYFDVPVVHVGGSRHGGRGFYHDVYDAPAYFETLRAVCSGRQTPTTNRELARRYAYALFFRSVLPMRSYEARYPHVTALNIHALEDLLPERDPSLDALCRGVLVGEDFFSDDERIWLAARQPVAG